MRFTYLARSSGSRGNALALVRLLATSNLVVSPSPVLGISAKNQDVGAARLDGSSNLVDSDIGDRNASSRDTSWRSVLIILLDDNTILGDVGQSDGIVLDVRNRTGGSGNSLDTNTVVGVGDGGVKDANSLDNIVGTSTN